MKKILYVNHGITKECGVYDLGVRHYESIKGIGEYEVIYSEIHSLSQFFAICDKEQPSAIIFNYMDCLFGWLTGEINKYACPKICIPHLFSKNNIESFKNHNIFNYYIVLDNYSPESSNVFKTDRPLSIYNNIYKNDNEVPTIGSFGFALKHKFFDVIVKHVNDCFDEAVINFHMPKAHFDSSNETPHVIAACREQIKKPGIKLNITTDFMGEYDVINMLNKNDINCLFYESTKDVGISSSLDYLVSAQRPILISESNMFRSFAPQLPTYPNTTLKDIYADLDYYQRDINTTYANSINNIQGQTKSILDRII